MKFISLITLFSHQSISVILELETPHFFKCDPTPKGTTNETSLFLLKNFIVFISK